MNWVIRVDKKCFYVLFTLLYYIITSALTSSLGLNKFFLYLGDVLNVVLFIYTLLYKKKTRKKIDNKVIYLMFLIIIIGVFVNIINFSSSFLLIWGIRNIARFFMFFYSCSILLKPQNYKTVFKVIKIMFFLSLPLCIYQRLFAIYSNGKTFGDLVGGIFLSYPGCNTPLNILLCVYVAYIASRFFQKKEKMVNFLIVVISAMIMSALAELKIFLVEFFIIILMNCIYNKMSLVKILKLTMIIIAFSLLMSAFISFNSKEYGENYVNIYSADGFIEYATRENGYDGDGDLNRLNAISIINTTIFKNDITKQIFGIGLGNSEYTQFYQSDFYKRYSYVHYQWFNDIIVYIEQGYLGIILYMLLAVQMYKKCKKSNNEYQCFSKILIILCSIMFIYNNSLRMEASGFLIYLLLSIAYNCNFLSKTIRKEINIYDTQNN